MMTENPLLRRGFRIPFHEIEPAHVEPGVGTILDRAEAAIERITSSPDHPTYENTLGELDRVSQEVREALTPVKHLLSVAETPELRQAHNSVLADIVQFWSGIPLNQELWARLRAFAETEEAEALSGIRGRHLEKSLREFRRAGADLPPRGKSRLGDIRVELARLQQKFSENVLDATAAFELLVYDESRLAGIPEGPLSRFREEASAKGLEGWLLTLDFPSYEPVMKYASDRSLREELHRAYVGRCREGEFDNTRLIPQILALRHEMAQLLGYEGFPDYRLEEAMARTGQAAQEFEEDLAKRTRPFWERDLAWLRRHAKESGIPELQPWDVAFVSESLRRERYAIDDEVLRPYFPLHQVLDGLFELVRRVFGLTVTERTVSEVWHPDVRYYEVRRENGTWLGAFYTDWYPRKEKRQGAWMHDFLTGGPGEDGRFKPHLGFIAGNFSPPEAERPALLTHREVQTVFHEFGHLLHHLTSAVPVPARAGLNVAWDWVELPSQLMENWTWEEEGLLLFGRHFETGEPLPRTLLERLRAARRFMGGWAQLRQISFGTLDLALHAQLAPRLPPKLTLHEAEGSETNEAAGTVMAFAEERLRPFSANPLFAEQHILTTFSHLFSGGYAAGYYSYLWSEVLDADVFTRFKAEGILNRTTGQAYVEAILSRGDSADPETLFHEFLGRDPSPDALLARNLGALENGGTKE
jgi:oligopeptidase A